jgi:hypothetical protein
MRLHHYHIRLAPHVHQHPVNFVHFLHKRVKFSAGYVAHGVSPSAARAAKAREQIGGWLNKATQISPLPIWRSASRSLSISAFSASRSAARDRRVVGLVIGLILRGSKHGIGKGVAPTVIWVSLCLQQRQHVAVFQCVKEIMNALRKFFQR